MHASVKLILLLYTSIYVGFSLSLGDISKSFFLVLAVAGNVAW